MKHIDPPEIKRSAVIQHCESSADFSLAVELTRAYIQWLNIDLAFQDIDEELAQFASHYGKPRGLYLLAFCDQQLAGGVGLREFAEGVCEMKRMYVYDTYQGLGIGRQLCEAIIESARQLGYTHMRLDTMNWLKAAVQLYSNYGFIEIEAYRNNPVPGAVFMELQL